MFMHENYQVETLMRIARDRRSHEYAHLLAHNRSNAGVARRLARMAGRTLLAVGDRLLAYSGERARRTPADLVPYIAPPGTSLN